VNTLQKDSQDKDSRIQKASLVLAAARIVYELFKWLIG
jgi:hypothetical protein